MTCVKAFDKYLALDKDERVPLSVTMHLLVCPACRTAVRKLTQAERLLARPLAAKAGYEPAASDPVVAAALARIAESGLSFSPVCPVEHPVSLYRWLVAGVVLVAGFAVLPFSPIGVWSRLVFGDSFSVPFFILCGVAVTVYCGFFVGTNIDFFVKKFSFHHSV